MKKMFSEEQLSEIIEMALSDHISFEQLGNNMELGKRRKEINEIKS